MSGTMPLSFARALRARGRRGHRGLLLLLVLLACTRSAPAPLQDVRLTAAPPPPEISTIVIPIRADLQALLPELEQQVPRSTRQSVRERGIDVLYDVRRSPLALRMIGEGLHTTTTIHYAVQACRGRFPCVSCGFGEPRRQARITLHSALAWTPDWRLSSTTRVLPVDYASPCEITWLDIDVTRRFVAPVVEEQLRTAARLIDRQLPEQTDLRPVAASIWRELQTPIELSPDSWLLFAPSDVSLSPISGSDGSVSTLLTLRAQTRVAVGERPASGNAPLPPLAGDVRTAGPPQIRVPFDLEITWDALNAIAAHEVAGMTRAIDGRAIMVESVRLAPGAAGRVRVEAMVDYRGGLLRNYRGVVLLEGTPELDESRSTLLIPDLEVSLDPRHRGFFAGIGERFARKAIRERLEAAMRFPLAAPLAAAREQITRGLNRELTPGVTLRAGVDGIAPEAVTPLRDFVAVRVVAVGSAEVAISRALN
jgi:hypothetical protein